jgi:hypothetical protein
MCAAPKNKRPLNIALLPYSEQEIINGRLLFVGVDRLKQRRTRWLLHPLAFDEATAGRTDRSS